MTASTQGSGRSAGPSGRPPEPPAVRMSGIVRRFGDTVALDGAEFELRRGEIHALLGENGAGKSTLMRILAGLLPPNAGAIEVEGRPVRLRSPRDAAALGIGMVHQHFTLVESFTVAENLDLALPERAPFWRPGHGLPRRRAEGSAAGRALALAERLGWRFEPEAVVGSLPVGLQQRLEIVKVLARDPRVLIFDEPTAVLAPVELDELFAVLARLRDEGRALVFISHKLQEVLRLCDRVTVLRRGRNAGTLRVAETDAAELARRMIGATGSGGEPVVGEPAAGEPAAGERAAPATGVSGEVVLEVEELRVPGAGRAPGGVEAVRGLSLQVRAGEILGLAGVDGNGQTELAEAIVGLRPATAGRIRLLGRELELRPAGRRREIGYIPQDRRRSGIVPGMSVRDNLILELHQEPWAHRGPWLRWDVLNAAAAEMLHRFDIRAALDQPAETLSGGNQQKIVIARALHPEPKLLVAVNPTRGVDVGATAYVHARLREQRARGAAILLISTELEEVLALADRVGVLYEGRLLGPVPPDTPREALGLMMGGAMPAGSGRGPSGQPGSGASGTGA